MAEKKEQNHDEKSAELAEQIANSFEELKQENLDLKEKWQRALADYQNLERRSKAEITQRVSDQTNNLLLNFIDIYEDFIRAENSLSKENIDTTGIIAVRKTWKISLLKIISNQLKQLGKSLIHKNTKQYLW